MSNWGIGLLSLSLLLIAYHTWYLGLPLLILSVIILFVTHKNKKKEEKK
ncbi:hypothetical protein ACFO26_08810 [Lactococcus nasutitermitis]|uniref:Uncharacterized protein n=1 Tax=Lactococcus nasutitermitis TaxID=1652957 RepID=A0ABV9JEX0_9LACT|nr:hypothetical protein [Lactococcus nasutitermitis]